MRRSVLIVVLLGCAACAHQAQAPAATAPVPAPAPAPAPPPAPAVATTPDEPFRTQKPAPLPTEPAFNAPVPVEKQLKNGARVLVVENHALPLVAVEISIQSGIDREPLNRRGLSGFVSRMLLEGTQHRSAMELDIARERLGAQLTTASDMETSTLHLNALRETLPDALDLLADVLLHPAFKKEDIERVRGLLLTSLSAKKGNGPILARDDLAKALWGDKNPWGLPSGGTPDTVKAITLKDLTSFHKTYYVPNNAVIAVSGDVTADDAVAALDKALASWKKGKVPTLKTAPFPPSTSRNIVLTDLPTGTQSQVVTGWRAPRANDPDILPLQVGNNVLGGLFTSRLNLNLREQKAFSYGVRSRVTLYRDVSAIAASGGIVAAHTAEAVTEYEKELQRMKSDTISDEEFDRAREAIIRSLPSLLETNDSVATAMAALVELELPLDYYATLPARVRAVQKTDVTAVVQKYIDPDHWPVVVVGPKAKVQQGLDNLGIGKVESVAP
jgi:zinc protease